MLMAYFISDVQDATENKVQPFLSDVRRVFKLTGSH
jgi:hypothetical protein